MTPAQLALWLTLASPPPDAYLVTGNAMSHESIMDYWSDTFLVQRWLPRKLAEVESNYRRKAQSYEKNNPSIGLSRGLMQINRHHEKELATKAGLGKFDWRDARQSIRVGVALFARLLKQSGGDYMIATASYNAGFARISSSGPIPGETIRYVEKVFGGRE